MNLIREHLRVAGQGVVEVDDGYLVVGGHFHEGRDHSVIEDMSCDPRGIGIHGDRQAHPDLGLGH